jgi:hypothetical protein
MQGNPGPQGPSGPSGSGAHTEDVWAFAGFTSTTYDGNLGGRTSAHAACAAEFTDAHMCHVAEYLLAESIVPVPANGAWLDSSIRESGNVVTAGLPAAGRDDYSGCDFWNDNAGTGQGIEPDGAMNYISCSSARSLACCNGAPKIQFEGFTSTSYDGNIGGRAMAHAICNAEFAGSRMCHVSQYLRTQSSTPVPAAGAWLDSSVRASGNVVTAGLPAAGRDDYSGCDFWNQNVGTGQGIEPDVGMNYISCSTPRPLACCSW